MSVKTFNIMIDGSQVLSVKDIFMNLASHFKWDEFELSDNGECFDGSFVENSGGEDNGQRYYIKIDGCAYVYSDPACTDEAWVIDIREELMVELVWAKDENGEPIAIVQY